MSDRNSHEVMAYSPLLKNDTNSVVSDCGERASRYSNISVYTPLHPVNSKYLTTFMILNYMIGSGILNQPYVVMKAGLVGSFCGFMLAAFLTWRSVNILTECGIYMNKFDYSAIAMHTYGRAGEKLVDLAVASNTLGSLIGYILVIGNTMADLVQSWGCDSVFCDPALIMVAVGIFIAPLCLFRHFGHLVILSVFSVATIWTVMFLVIIGGSYYQVPSTHVNIFNGNGSLVSLGSIIGALSICTGNFQAYVSTEKSAQNTEDWKALTGWAIGIGTAMCVALGTGMHSFQLHIVY